MSEQDNKPANPFTNPNAAGANVVTPTADVVGAAPVVEQEATEENTNPATADTGADAAPTPVKPPAKAKAKKVVDIPELLKSDWATIKRTPTSETEKQFVGIFKSRMTVAKTKGKEQTPVLGEDNKPVMINKVLPAVGNVIVDEEVLIKWIQENINTVMVGTLLFPIYAEAFKAGNPIPLEGGPVFDGDDIATYYGTKTLMEAFEGLVTSRFSVNPTTASKTISVGATCTLPTELELNADDIYDYVANNLEAYSGKERQLTAAAKKSVVKLMRAGMHVKGLGPSVIALGQAISVLQYGVTKNQTQAQQIDEALAKDAANLAAEKVEAFGELARTKRDNVTKYQFVLCALEAARTMRQRKDKERAAKVEAKALEAQKAAIASTGDVNETGTVNILDVLSAEMDSNSAF